MQLSRAEREKLFYARLRERERFERFQRNPFGEWMNEVIHHHNQTEEPKRRDRSYSYLRHLRHESFSQKYPDWDGFWD